MTNCTCIAKKWRGARQQIPAPSRWTFGPHFQIRSGATDNIYHSMYLSLFVQKAEKHKGRGKHIQRTRQWDDISVVNIVLST